jgi:hypothetical protein
LATCSELANVSRQLSQLVRDASAAAERSKAA